MLYVCVDIALSVAMVGVVRNTPYPLNVVYCGAAAEDQYMWLPLPLRSHHVVPVPGYEAARPASTRRVSPFLIDRGSSAAL